MTGLLLKDMYSLNKNIKQYGISSILFIVIAISMKSSVYLVYMITLTSTMLIFTALTNDEMSNWDKYALTMPVARKDMVVTKYVLLSILVFGGVFISTTVGLIMSHFFSFESSKTIIEASLGGVGFLCLIFSIMLPIVFRYGVEKGRILIFVAVGIPVLIVMGGVKILERFNISMPTLSQVKPFLYYLPAILLAMLFISYKVSLSIYEKKEF